ncbi:MAG TPA: long-chain fatty acid--CoA ligase [Ktedonobacterales bacterium]|nr:long-chain fatty acid--CoA ligase [Ktedonobacterales bacterium]
MQSPSPDTALSLGTMFLGVAARRAQEVAVFFEGHPIPYGDLARQTEAFAMALRLRGILPGDRVAIILPNLPHFLPAYFGAIRAGAIAITMNPTYRPPEIRHIFTDAQVVAAVVWSDALPLVEQAIGDDTSPRLLITVSLPASEGTTAPAAAVNRETISFEQLLGEAAAAIAAGKAPAPLAEPNPDNVAVILYTSGTTGKAKGAMLTHRNLLSNAQAIIQLADLGPQDVLMSVLPLFHVFGSTVCMVAPLLAGAPIVLVPRFDPRRLIPTVQQQHVTILAGVPSMYALLLRTPLTSQDISSLRLCVSGGAALPGETLRTFKEKFGIPLIEGYGLTESSPAAVFNPPNGVQKAGSIGLPIPGVEVQVHDIKDQPLPAGQIGELAIRGPNIMKGYYNLPEATAQTIRNGWLYTGDLGYQDEEGYFFIVDRAKDVIIKGGLNVYPRELEEVLMAHPKVAEVAVVGVGDAMKGESIKACITPRDGQNLTRDEIIDFMRERVAPFKVPNLVEFYPLPAGLPKNATGKVLKTELRQGKE